MNPDQNLVKDYLEALKHQRRLSGATLENYGRALALLFSLLKNQDLKALDAAQVRRFVALLEAGIRFGQMPPQDIGVRVLGPEEAFHPGKQLFH